jgi:hypothetical protein
MNTNRTTAPVLRRQRIRVLAPDELRHARGGSYGLARPGYPHPPASYTHRHH